MKKLYSNTLMQLILALCTFSFVACQEFDIDSQPEGPLNIQIDALESYTVRRRQNQRQRGCVSLGLFARRRRAAAIGGI